MEYYLFESPYMALVVAAIVELVMLIQWSMRRDRKSSLLLLVGPAIAALAVGLDLLVETPREGIETTVRTLVQCAEVEDSQGVIDLISEDFSHRYVNKAAAAAVVRGLLAGDVIESNHITLLEVTAADERGGAGRMTVVTNFSQGGRFGFAGLQKSRWEMEFVRDPDGVYRVSDMEMVSIGEQGGIDVFTERLPGGL